MLKQQQNRSRGGLFQETSADMRALFLATPSSRKQSYGGTGVFFPRRVGCSIDSNKKSGKLFFLLDPIQCYWVFLGGRKRKVINM